MMMMMMMMKKKKKLIPKLIYKQTLVIMGKGKVVPVLN
jgi:hypothetical protein